MAIADKLLDIIIPSGLRLTPDAQYVVYAAKPRWKTTEHPKSSLWIARTSSSESARPLTHGSNDHTAQPSPDGRSVAFLSDRGIPGRASAIYSIDLDGGEPHAITPATNLKPISKFQFSPDGKQIAYLAPAEREDNNVVDAWGEDVDYANLRLVDVEYGSVKVVFGEKAHVVDFSWSPQGDEIAIVTQDAPDADSAFVHGRHISVVHLADATTRPVCHLSYKLGDLTWLDSMLYFTTFSTLSDDNSSRSVYAVDPYSGDSTFARVAHGVEDCVSSIRGVESELVVHVLHGMEDQLRFLNGKILYHDKRSILGFDASLGSAGETSVVVAEGTLSHPPEVFAISSNGSKLQLSNHGEAFEDVDVGHTIFLECRTLDGKEKLEGMYLVPRQFSRSSGRPTHALPTVVIPHGGPYWRITDSFNAMDMFFIPRLLSEGYGLLIPNYRGSSGRGDRFARYAGRGSGKTGLSDIDAMTQLVIDRGYADPSRLVIAGHSQGGFFSYLAAVRNGQHEFKWRYRAAIPVAGVSECDAILLTSDLGYGEGVISASMPWDSLKSDASTRTDSALWEFKEAADAGRIPPMLLLHGSADERVPLEQLRGFKRGLLLRGLEFECAVYKGEDHFFKQRASAADMMERIVRFLARHLAE